jgi:glycine betaine/choline ABC-type transport system substrate-binding protein
MVDRRAFLIGTGAVLLAGCARATPGTTSQTPTPSPSASPLSIAVEDTPTGALLGSALVGALAKLDVAAVAQPFVGDWLGALRAGTVVAAPVWAATVWSSLSDSEDPPADVLADLAGLVEPTVSVLTPGSADGGLVWMVAASTGIKSMEDLAAWSKGKGAAVPALAVERSDGIAALNTIYGASFSTLAQDDPAVRAQWLLSGQAAIGAFRRTENLGVSGLVELIDPDQLCQSDPLAMLANAAFVDQHPDQALALNAVIQALTNTELLALEQQVAQGETVAEVTRSWLTSRGLG